MESCEVWSELSELFTLPPGVGVCDCPARPFSGSRTLAPLATGGGWPGPPDEDMSLMAGGRAPEGCCLLFFPKRNDMATGWGRGNSGTAAGCPSHTHSA